MNRTWSIEAALFVALFLVVQAFFSGLALGARADVTLSPGETLCLGSGGAATVTPFAPSNRVHLADCCTLGCPMLGGMPAPQAAGLAHPSVLAGLVSAPSGNAHDPGRFELSPLRSRAPPEA